jgi:hypothetical protein
MALDRATAHFTSENPALSVSSLDRLRLFNGVMSGLHLVQGLAILLLSSDFTLPVTTSFVRSTGDGPGEGIPEYNKLLDLPLAPFIATFLFISAASHLLLTLPGINRWYSRKLEEGVNWARWWEYAFSSSIMIVIIAMFPGIYDLGALMLIFSMNMMMIFSGLIMESVNKGAVKRDVNWLPFWLGCFAGIVPWVVITLYLASPGTRDLNEVPAFVYGIFFSLFVFFNCFALNMFLQYRRIGPWRSYLFGEYGYVILSLTAKSALAWQVFAGTLN